MKLEVEEKDTSRAKLNLKRLSQEFGDFVQVYQTQRGTLYLCVEQK